jgi:hypothetical protein
MGMEPLKVTKISEALAANVNNTSHMFPAWQAHMKSNSISMEAHPSS